MPRWRPGRLTGSRLAPQAGYRRAPSPTLKAASSQSATDPSSTPVVRRLVEATVADDSSARLATLVESLTGDLLFAMSRGSKELFHSDTLAWYLERHQFLREALLNAWQVP